jgi:hypothetical protein
MASTAINRASGTKRNKTPKNISVFWIFVAVVAIGVVLITLMPAPGENAHVGASYPSTTTPDVYIRVAADRRVSDTRRVKVSE